MSDTLEKNTKSPLFDKNMSYTDVLDGIYTILYNTGYALTEGDYMGVKIFVMSKISADGTLTPVCQIAQIVPGKGIDSRTADSFRLKAKPVVVQ
jgi:hypothetical protein